MSVSKNTTSSTGSSSDERILPFTRVVAAAVTAMLI
jgi:hypothetical protein